jgi:hypothetical protein
MSTVTFTRKELIAKLAAVGVRAARSTGRLRDTDPEHGLSIHRIAAFVTECGREFDLTSDEQLLFLKFIVSDKHTSEELLKDIDKPAPGGSRQPE